MEVTVVSNYHFPNKNIINKLSINMISIVKENIYFLL